MGTRECIRLGVSDGHAPGGGKAELGPSCVFYGDMYGCGGENPQEPVSQLDDIIRCRKLFAYGEQHDYWDHGECTPHVTCLACLV